MTLQNHKNVALETEKQVRKFLYLFKQDNPYYFYPV